jgi:hypothetical protein
LELQDHVINGDPEVEVARRIELQNFVDGLGRDLLLDVGEGATVTENREYTLVWSDQTEELGSADAEEAMPLCDAVFAGATAQAVDNSL